MPTVRAAPGVAHWTEAVQETKAGVRLLVEVTAAAKEARFPDAFNAWRDGRIGVRVRAPPEDGKANAEVVKSVASFLGVPHGSVRIEAGLQDARKSIVVAGLSREVLVGRLAVALGAL